jgi:LuxR family transcriptional regulator, maltose regulon positive regulatory protein
MGSMRGHPREGGAVDRHPRNSPSGIVVLETKLRPAPNRRDWVERRALHDQLVDAADKKVVLISAPVGFGKTTVLAQWRTDPREARPFAWVTVDASDNEPLRLWTYLIEAIRQIEPGIGGNVTSLMNRQDVSLREVVIPRFLDELAILPRRIVIVLDDFFQLTNRECHESIAEIIEYLPSTAQVVISTRTDPPLSSLRRIRLTGEMLELRAVDLRFSIEEARALLRQATGTEIALRNVLHLVERTEGWPAGLYLAALSLQDRPDVDAFIKDFAGDNRHVVDYLTTEILNRLPERVRRFLVRTSILEKFSSSLCDEVVGEEGSAAILKELERNNLFLVPVDDQRNWFRYHHLFKELLQSDLNATTRELVPELHRRASQWHRRWGFLDDALSHAIAADDVESSRELISGNWLAYCNAGRLETVRSWIGSLGEKRVASDPVLSLTAAWTQGLSGHRDEIERWLELASRGSFEGALPDGSSSLESGIALARAAFGHGGVAGALAAARVAVEVESRLDARWRPSALTALGFYLYLSGEREVATAQFEEVARQKTRGGIFEVIFALAQLSIMASEGGRPIEAARVAREAVAIVDEYRLSESPHAAAAFTALGQSLATAEDSRGASRELERALELRRKSACVAPWPTLQLLLALVPIRASLGDREGAAILLKDARAIVDAYPDAGTLGPRVEELERSIAAPKQRPAPLGEPLTDRELSVLRLLPTSLTQRQIGDELFLSINTVKTHVKSIFRKLGVESRSEAVARADELSLLTPAPTSNG